MSEIRLREDAAFAQTAQVNLQDLHLIDAPRRLNIGMAQISTGRALDVNDEQVSSEISAHITGLAPDMLLAPLALGDHIDHRVAQHAAMRAGIAGLCFYEDLPYAARLPDAAPSERAHQLDSALLPHIVSSPDGANWKATSAAIYKSQIDRNTVREIADFSLRYYGGERLWITPRAAELFAYWSSWRAFNPQ